MKELARAMELAKAMLGLDPSNAQHVRWVKQKYEEFQGDLNKLSEFFAQQRKEDPHEGRLDLPVQ